jgi:hypothetical protein
MTEDLNSNQISLNPDSVRSFTEKLREKSGTELLKILTRYISYQPETVEAALIVSVDQGLISYGLKMLLSKQMMANFIAHSKQIKATRWESDNAFLEFVKRYTDDEIYDFIENPSEIVMDVYHAILSTAKERELISENNFKELYKKAMLGTRTDEEIESAERIDHIKDIDLNFSNVHLNEAEIEAEKQKYWKCPFCNQVVNIESAVCWNCKGERPEKFERPDKQEVIKEFIFHKPKSLNKAGSLMMGSGALMILLGIARKDLLSFHYYDYFLIGLGIIAIIAGFIFFIKGITDKWKKN